MKKMNLLVMLLAFFGSLFFLIGCQDDEVNIATEETILELSDPQVKKEVDYLFETKQIDHELYNKWINLPKEKVLYIYEKEEDGEIIIVEDYSIRRGGSSDGITINRSVIQEQMHKYYNNSNDSAYQSNRMKRLSNMYDSSGGVITCRVLTQNGNGRILLSDSWRDALEDAVEEWNNLNLKVKFKVVDTSNTNIVDGYVTVFMESLADDSLWAIAGTPNTPGYFGEYIKVNTTTTNEDPTADARTKIMVHELGHIVGFHHTDQPLISGVYYTYPKCNEPWWDPNRSFMYQYIEHDEGWSNNGFSNCDIENLEYYWG